MFPAIRAAVQEFRQGFGTELIGLGLKGREEFGFDNNLTIEQAKELRIWSHLGGYGPTWANVTVDENSASALSTFWACRRLISGCVGMTPLQMMQERGKEKTPAKKHPAYRMLHNAPNAEMTAFNLREAITGHIVVHGNGNAKIQRLSRNGQAAELWPYLPGQVRQDREKTGQKRLVHIVKDGNDPERVYTVESGKAHDILHIPGLAWDGIRGYSVIAAANQSIGTALAAEMSAAFFFASGGRVPYILTHPLSFKNREQFDKFRADWEKTYSDPTKVPILENDIKYQQIGHKPEDSQLLQTRQATPAEICRWFGISPHLVGDLSRATFSNIENLALQFVKFTLTDWFTRWEQALWLCILTPEEKDRGFYFKHNVNGLLRGEFLTRMQGYATGLQNGWLNRNEVRAYEDLNPFEGGDEFTVQSNMMPITDGIPQTVVQTVGKPSSEEGDEDGD